MAGIELDGFEGLETLLQEMTIDEADEKKAIKKALEPIADEIEKNTPVGTTGRLKRLKVTIKKDGLAVVGTIKMGAFYDIFQEFGTSKSKKNVGFFERSVNRTQREAIEILTSELLDKVK